ncbi:hypothetical protein AB0H63_07810, partial [Micromonospora echinospora]
MEQELAEERAGRQRMEQELAEERAGRQRMEQELAEERAGRQRMEQELAELRKESPTAAELIARSRHLLSLNTDPRIELANLLPAMERALGAEHSATPATQEGRGDLVAARDELTALLPVMEAVLGAEHPDVLVMRHHLAWVTGLMGDEAGARDQLTALLPVMERVLGAEHLNTLLIRHQLAQWAAQRESSGGSSEDRR